MTDIFAALADSLSPKQLPPYLDSPGALASWATKGTEVTPPHLKLLDDHLIRLEKGEIDRLAVFMPPRHGKSNRISRFTPPWFLARNPEKRVMLASYEADFASTWGRKARDVIEQHPELGVRVSQASKAAHRWDLHRHDGGMVTAGVGGPITGKGAHLLIIDDYCKNSEEANSVALRDRAWDWYRSTAQTRLEPGGAVVLVACMTGDTPVLRPDGRTTALRDIRPGDVVATYEHGGLTTAQVRNWANQGPDSIYSIRMQSGRSVRANARHPFLTVENGVESWVRLESLRVGTRVRSVAVPTPEWVAPPPAVSSLRSARACVCITTARRGGRQGSEHLLSTPNHIEPFASRADTASLSTTTTGFSQSKTAGVQSVAGSPGMSGSRSTGPRSSASTMTTEPGRCAVCSATTATWSSPEAIPQKSFRQPLFTWAVGLDEIVEITSAGVEDVFDIQVDRTENFIANGLCSHNTRWHEDDLAGRLLAEEGERWTVLSLPALADDDDALGRPKGAPLWPQRYDTPALAQIRASVGPYFWAALYQQRPAPVEGALFKRSSFRYWKPLPDSRAYRLLAPAVGGETESLVPMSSCRRFMTVDVAASVKTSADYTVAAVWAVTPGDRFTSKLLLLDRVRVRLEGPDQVPMILRLKAVHNPSWIGVEKAAYGLTLLQELRRHGVPLRELKPDTDKVSRALVAVARCENGQCYFPADAPWLEEWESELLSFPVGAHDDMVDVFAYAADSVTLGLVRAPGLAVMPPATLTDGRSIKAWEAIQDLDHRRGRRRRR